MTQNTNAYYIMELNGSFLGSIWDFQSLIHTFLDPITIVPLQQMTVLFDKKI